VRDGTRMLYLSPRHTQHVNTARGVRDGTRML
jgi:hypothetical protein